MKINNNQKGLAHLVPILLVLLIIVIGLVGWKVWGNKSKNSDSSCNRSSNLEICASPKEATVGPTDKLEFSVSVKNISGKDYKYTGGGCGPEIDIKVNDKNVLKMGACTADITEEVLKAGQTDRYKTPVETNLLKTGDNLIELSWGDVKSKPISVTLSQPTAVDAKKYEDCYGAQTPKNECAIISILFHEGFYKENVSTCSELEKHVSHLKLKAYTEYCNLARMGLIAASVPKNEVESIISKLENLKAVQSASVDDKQITADQ